MSDFVWDIHDFRDIMDNHHHDSQRPVVVEFYSKKCRHCNDFAPTYEEVSRNHPGIEFYRIDVFDRSIDDYYRNLDQATSCTVKGLPTVVGFHGGKIDCDADHYRMHGKHTREEFEKWVEDLEPKRIEHERLEDHRYKKHHHRHNHKRYRDCE
jgi:thiol-disulfide isomerase/thioredoxin